MAKGLPKSLKNSKLASQNRVININTTVTVSAVSTGIGFGTKVIGDLLQGNLLFLGAVANIKISGSGTDPNLTATWEGDFSIGTTPTADSTLNGTDVNIIPSTPLPAAVGEIGSIVRSTNATSSILDNTDNNLEINLNVLVDAANITDDTSVTLRVTGQLYVTYFVLGDD